MSDGINVGVALGLIEPGASHSEDSRKWIIEVAEAVGLSDIAVPPGMAQRMYRPVQPRVGP
jgi:hypothetical protein